MGYQTYTQLKCYTCRTPITQFDFDVFEKMCWNCFHLIFEHNGIDECPDYEINCPLKRRTLMIEMLADKIKERIKNKYAITADTTIGGIDCVFISKCDGTPGTRIVFEIDNEIYTTHTWEIENDPFKGRVLSFVQDNIETFDNFCIMM